MIKIKAATTRPSATGRNTPRNVSIVQPKIRKVYIIADFKIGSFLANPNLKTNIDSRTIVI